jgi:hypothetical protein
MAIVTELSGNGGGPVGSGPENQYASTTRQLADVHGTATPAFVGEVVTDIALSDNYIGRRNDPSSTAALAIADWAKLPHG